jgi:hypothetical protein
MTALVAVMNKQAVALAADSAGTVQIPGKEQHKIYAMNKVFALSKSKPVGMMICGDSQFLGLPWESIIKQFRRKEKDRSLATIPEWRDSFLAYLGELTSGVDSKTRDQQFLYRYPAVLKSILAKLEQGGARPEEMGDQLEGGITARIEELNEENQIAEVSAEDIDEFVAKNLGSIEEAENQLFLDHGIEPLELEEARKPILRSLFERSLPNKRGVSEIVFAGFGEDDWFPSVFSIHVDGSTNGQVRHWVGTEAKVTREYGSEIAAFAQADIVWTLLRGIHPSLHSDLDQALQAAFGEHVPGMIGQLLEEHIEDTDTLREIVSKIVEIGGKAYQAIRGQSDQYCFDHHTMPVLASIQHLGKGELAQLAESLITTTSLKYRMAIDSQESVGGPVDVAVISKDEGFIWIQRKHYFELQQNPAFGRLEPEL